MKSVVVVVGLAAIACGGCGKGKSQAVDGGGGTAQGGGSGAAGAGAGGSGGGSPGAGGTAVGAAGVSGRGGASGGASGTAGTTGNCGAPRAEPQFTVRRVAGLEPSPGTPGTAGITENLKHSSIVIGTGGVPTFVYLARSQVFALPLTNVAPADAGVSGSVAKILSGPFTPGTRIDGVSRGAVKSDGTVAVAYLANGSAYYVEWSGNINDAPAGSNIAPALIAGGSSKIGLGIDRRDRANLVFMGSTGVNYASVENGTPSVEMIDSASLPYAAVGADSNGNAVAALIDRNDSLQMIVATRRGGTWQLTRTDPSTNTFIGSWDFGPIVQIDSRDRLNLFFAAVPDIGAVEEEPLGWWISDGAGWTKTTAQLPGPLYWSGDGYHADVALTPTGEIYVARGGLTYDGLFYDHFDGCRWIKDQQLQVFTDPNLQIDVWWPSVAVDAAGRPHFSFQEIHANDHTLDVLWSAEPVP